MHYAENPLPPALAGLAKACWTLDAGGAREQRIEHRATPDGCIEIIRRLRGRSRWHREQPEVFVAGLIDRPAHLVFSGDAAFVGLRLWPWTWHALGGRACAEFRNDWLDLDGAQLPDEVRRSFASLDADNRTRFADLLAPAVASSLATTGSAILASTSVAQLSARTGLPLRQLQRWFRQHVGIAPRTYLRLLRFQDTFAALQSGDDALVDHAAARGFADQAHMAREFRALAGLPATPARKRARGPFV